MYTLALASYLISLQAQVTFVPPGKLAPDYSPSGFPHVQIQENNANNGKEKPKEEPKPTITPPGEPAPRTSSGGSR